MKHRLLLLLVLGGVFTSCKRDFTCQCVSTYTEPAYVDVNGEAHQGRTLFSTVNNIIRVRKKDAESKCRESETIYSTVSYNQGQGPFTTIIECEVL